MGEESTTEPPSRTKPASTSASRARDRASAPTSKVAYVPSPITGRVSPLCAMARLRGGVAAAPAASPSATVAPSASSVPRARRRPALKPVPIRMCIPPGAPASLPCRRRTESLLAAPDP